MARKKGGWFGESRRHSMAARGVRTSRSGVAPARVITNIAFGTRQGEGSTKASVYDIKTGGWRYVTAKPDDFTHLLMEIEYENIAGPGLITHTRKEVLMLKSEAAFDEIDEWLEKNVNEVASTVWEGDHAHVRVIGRVTASDIQRGTGLPSGEVIAKVETVADE